jgi:DNA (cytosine-5)-methyltransferase 1
MYTLNATGVQGVAQPIPFGVGEQPDVGHCLRSGASKADKHESTTYIKQSMAVRRLTPTECERLQGFPDGYTDIQPNGKPTADGPRYKALGNSMAVPVMKWIGERINFVDKIK